MYFLLEVPKLEASTTEMEIPHIIGERAKRARHSQVCSIENRIYIYYGTCKYFSYNP